MQLAVRAGLWCAALAGLLAACGTPLTAQQPVTAESLVTATVTVVPTETPLAAIPESTPESPSELVLWMPEPLAPPNNQAAALVLASQLDGFQTVAPGVDVNIRLKRAEGVGGLVATLFGANQVAPEALPDLTLIRRRDLRQAVQEGIALPLDGRISTAVREDIYSAVLRLGQVGTRLYGLPYALEIQHIAYQLPPADFSTFESTLAERRPLVIPAGQRNGINDVFLIQYVAAGGTLVGGNPGTLNVDALRTVLEFYEEAVAEGVIDPSVLNYPTAQDYQAGLVDGRITAAVVTSRLYLDLLVAGNELETSPIPVPSETPMTMVDGWIWILTTKNAERQAVALRFLEWMFDARRQAAYTRAITMLPSGRAAMRSWGNRAYVDFAGSLLENAILPLADNEGSVTARAIQNALVAVISGEQSADEALADVVDQLTG